LEEVAGVGPDAVVGPLPEIGRGVRLDPERTSGAVHGPPGRRAMPAELRRQGRARERGAEDWLERHAIFLRAAESGGSTNPSRSAVGTTPRGNAAAHPPIVRSPTLQTQTWPPRRPRTGARPGPGSTGPSPRPESATLRSRFPTTEGDTGRP